MQSTTLIIRIGGAVFVRAMIIIGMMMVHVSDPNTLSKVGSNIPRILDGMLHMYADQRRNTCCLG
jgi:hypothetical protein